MEKKLLINSQKELLDAVKSLNVGLAEDHSTFVGSVINKEQAEKIRSIIKQAKVDANLLVEHPGVDKLSENFIKPVVFTNIPKDSSINDTEIFGPVLQLYKVDSIKEACFLANEVRQGLTAGVYSRSPENIRYLREHLEVGNLYINRKCIGAMVSRQPFGGIKFSGIGSKAGGESYLDEFVYKISICENSARRGFSPELL